MKSLVDYIKEEQSINEMSTSIKGFREGIVGKFRTLITHLCLCIYSKLYIDGRYYDHWAQECRTQLIRYNEYTLKSGNKNKVIERIFIECGFENKNEVLKFSKTKFKEEHIDEDTQDILVSLYVTHVDELLEMLSKINKHNIYDLLHDYIFNIVKHQNENG